MKVVILTGGLGTRLAEETSVRPKPMVEIGGRPILWHIMKMDRPFRKLLILTALQLAGSGFVYWFCYQLATANPTSRGNAVRGMTHRGRVGHEGDAPRHDSKNTTRIQR